MFGRIVWKMLRGGKGRTLVALLAITSGAAVISALLNVQFDMQHKLAEEFRTLGANIVIAPQSGAQTASLGNSANSGLASSATPVLLNADVIEAGLKNNRTSDVVASAPFLFVVVRANETPVVVAGTWLDQLPGLNPTWKLEGSWVASRDDRSQCLIGRSVAKQLGLTPAGQITLAYLGRTAALRVAGILDSGAAEDDQVFVDLPVAQTLAGTPGGIGLWQLSVSGTSASIGAYAARLAEALPTASVRPDSRGDGSRRQSAASHAATDRVDGGADSGAHGAVRSRDDGRARDGAPRGCGPDEGAWRLDRAHRESFPCRGECARRGGRTDWLACGHRARAMDRASACSRPRSRRAGKFSR